VRPVLAPLEKFKALWAGLRFQGVEINAVSVIDVEPAHHHSLHEQPFQRGGGWPRKSFPQSLKPSRNGFFAYIPLKTNRQNVSFD